MLIRDVDMLTANDAPGTLTGVLLDQLEILTTGPDLGDRANGCVKAAEDLMFLFSTPEGGNATVMLPFTVAQAQ